jgi:hypothetical protein
VALDFQRNVIRPALGALAKAVVEGRHDRGEILQERQAIWSGTAF